MVNPPTSSVARALKKLQKSEKNIIIFYYSGHGFNNKKTSTRWPTLCTYERADTANGIPGTPKSFIAGNAIIKYLMHQKKKSALIIFDCCNAPDCVNRGHHLIQNIRSSDQDYVLMTQDDLTGFTNLLLSSKGIVVAAAARVGDYGYGNIGVGGLFTTSFLYSIKKKGCQQGITWEDIFHTTCKRTHSLSPCFGTSSQHPIYEIKPS